MLGNVARGSELGHSTLAQALARSGYLVAALRHPGDNWQDTSLRDGPGASRYFSQRPAQVSHVIGARVRAVVAMAPLGAPFTAQSLARIAVPTLLIQAEGDRVLMPRFHAGWVARHMPQAQRVSVPKAWHFVFMDTPGMPLPSPDGDIGADPPGFDRAAFLAQLGQWLPAFFDQAWR